MSMYKHRRLANKMPMYTYRILANKMFMYKYLTGGYDSTVLVDKLSRGWIP